MKRPSLTPAATVPTPMAVLGDIAGAKDNLPYSEEVHAYMRMLADASPCACGPSATPRKGVR